MSENKWKPSTAREAEPVTPDSMPSDRAGIPLLLVLFFGSGCAALIYEIVWFQLLQLVIGSSAVSLGVLLGTYHGRHVPRQPAAAALHFRRASIRCVFTRSSKCGIGVCGLVVLFEHAARSISLYAATGGTACSECCCAHWSRPSACCRPHC